MNGAARKKLRTKKEEHIYKQSLESVLETKDEIQDSEFTEVDEQQPGGLRVVDAQQIQVQDERQAQLKLYQDGLPFDKDRVRARVLDHGRNIWEDSVCIGKYLIWAKEEMGHGNFLDWLENEVGMSHQRAGECMRIAEQVMHSERPVRDFFVLMSNNSKTKAMALLDVSPEEAKEAMQKGTFLGQPISKAAAMSTRELRQALEEEEAKNEHLRARNAELDWKNKKLAVDLERERDRDKLERTSDETLFETFALLHQANARAHQVFTEYAREHGDDHLMREEIQEEIQVQLHKLGSFNSAHRQTLVPNPALLHNRFYIPERPASVEDEG